MGRSLGLLMKLFAGEEKRDVTKEATVLLVPAGALCRRVPAGGANDVI